MARSNFHQLWDAALKAQQSQAEATTPKGQATEIGDSDLSAEVQRWQATGW